MRRSFFAGIRIPRSPLQGGFLFCCQVFVENFLNFHIKYCTKHPKVLVINLIRDTRLLHVPQKFPVQPGSKAELLVGHFVLSPQISKILIEKVRQIPNDHIITSSYSITIYYCV